MALSKCPRAGSCGDLQQLCEWGELAFGWCGTAVACAFPRPLSLAPLIEIGEDIGVIALTEEIKAIASSVFDASASSFASSSSAAGAVVAAVARKIEDRPLTKALEELSKETGKLWVIPLALALAPTAGVAPLVLAGVGVPMKLTYCGVSVFFLCGAWKFASEQKGISRGASSVYIRANFVMLASSAVQVTLAFGGLPMLLAYCGAPASIMAHVVYPEALLYYVGNMFLHPLMLLNLGYLAGYEASTMTPSIIISMLGNTCVILSTTTLLPTSGLLLASSAIFCLHFQSTVCFTGLVDRASTLSFANKTRTEHGIDSMLFFWSLPVLVQALTYMDCMTVAQSLYILSYFDVTAKLGVCHISLKSRTAVETSARHFDGVEDARS